jgi:phytoene dehydrogenase-like protein
MADITIVGGGLAGMVAALRLLERGCRISLIEASERVGGKAGATKHGQDFDEHGYHIFPDWYYNARRLATELGILDHFVDCEDFFQLAPGHFPNFKNFKNITSWRYAWRNLTAGVIPFFEAFLFYYAALDLMSQPYSYRAQLDQVTVTGFLRSRYYRTDRVAAQFQELMLKGISVPTYEVSAMTMRSVMRFWVKSPIPMHRILKGNLQEFWIDPLRRKLEEQGCVIHFGQRLTHIESLGGRVARLRFSDPDGNETVRDIAPDSGRVILAIPVEQIAPLIDDGLYAIDPNLAQLRYLRTRAMAGFNIYFNRRVPNMPKGHVNLIDSKFGISFIDVSQTWKGYDATVLNLIASDFTALEGLSPDVAMAELMADLRRYFPDLSPDDIIKTDFQSHRTEPLFMNNVGGWAFRPEASTNVPNLYLAGDYCRSHIDLVSMEGAISTGLLAAEAVRKDEGLPSPVEILVPPTYPDWLIRVGKIALIPVAMLAYLGARYYEHAAVKH